MSSTNDEMKLTAYALGELTDDTERAAVETRLANDPAAAAEVARIRDVAKMLSDELAAEPVPMTRAIDLGQLQRQRRRPRWAGRLAIAAAVAVVVGGVAFSVLAPSLNRARETATVRVEDASRLRQMGQPPTIATNDSRGANPAARAAAQPAEQAQQHAPAATPVGNEEKKVPYDDILRYPADMPAPSTAAPAPGPAPGAQPVTPGTLTLGTTATDPNAAAPFGVPGQASSATTLTPTNIVTGSVTGGKAFSRGTQINGATLAVRGTSVNSSGMSLGENRIGGGGSGGGGAGAGDRTYRQQAPYAVKLEISPARDAGDGGVIERERRAMIEPVDGKHNTEAYDRVVDNAFLDVMQNPLSTFSIDVDTASYSNMRRFLMQGQKPPKDSVRIEELINYFPYDYDPPAKDAKEPFATHVEVADCPWRPEHRLVRVAIKGKEIAADKRPASNLVFLLDVSGSMQPENKLPLVKRSMRMLLEQLNGEDRVAIVIYAGSSGLALPSTACTEGAKDQILGAIQNLSAGGSTNGEQGIQLAYTIAKQNFIEGGTNRVILCTDGDFNVGVTNQGDLTRVIEEKAKGGIFLSVLGFGMGNLKDSTMEKLADKGNGNYAYIDTQQEAKKVLVEQMSGTLVTIAKDVKIQIEFNPAVVESYRLIGYENRLLAKEDFNDDKKDAGEIGAGHEVTALYEIVPAGKKGDAEPATRKVDELKYQKPAPKSVAAGDDSGEMLTLKLRYKQPDGDKSALIETPVKDDGGTFAKSSRDFKFASSVAAFGMILRDSPHRGRATYPAVLEWAEDGVGADKSGYRAEFLELVKRAKATEGQ